MAGSATWRIVHDNTDDVIEAFESVASKAVRITAFLLVEQIAENIRDEGLIDTGAMRSSDYAEFHDGSGRTIEVEGPNIRQLAVKAARAKRPGAAIASRGKKPASEFEARVAIAIEYAIYHELGAPRAGIPSRPFVGPAVEMHRGTLTKVVKDLMSGGDGNGG